MDKDAFAKLEKYAFEHVPCAFWFRRADGVLFHMYGETWNTCGCMGCRFKRLVVSLRDKPEMEQIDEAALNDSPPPGTTITSLRSALISARYGLRIMKLINAVAYDDRFRQKREAIVGYLEEQSRSFEAALTDQGQQLPTEADLARKFPRMITSAEDLLDGPESRRVDRTKVLLPFRARSRCLGL